MSLLQRAYIQKSRIFLLPLVGIRKDRIYRPTNTYISSKDLDISANDEKLMVTFSKDYETRELESINRLKLRNMASWDKFESTSLLDNRNFSDFYEAKDEYVYVFDLSDWSKDWKYFLNGQYSHLSADAKASIMDFRMKTLTEIEQKKLYCYLYPYKQECINCFAEELGMAPGNLGSGKHIELCSKPDLKLEDYKYDKILIDESKDSEVT